MSEGGPPSWMPAVVGSAARHGSASDEDLLTGAAWDGLLDRLRAAGDIIRSDRVPPTPLEQAAAYRHLLVLLALGIDEALRSSDPYVPKIAPGNVDAVLKWGMDCPDAAYSGASVRADATYRVRGSRGTVRYLGFQVMGGRGSLANVVAEDVTLDDDGSFEMVLSAEPHPGNWMPLPDGASSLVVRQFFYDWGNETAARLSIECLHHPPIERRSSVPTPSVIARQLLALGDFANASLGFWLDVEEAGRARGINAFREPDARTDLGGAAENVSVWGSWQLGDGEALVIEVTPPRAQYWSVSMGNCTWATLDYANHQTSLNGHQASLDDDGVFRAVVAADDPGVANWLDTCGYAQGPMIFRWLRADGAPVPEATRVPIAELDDILPASTRRVSPAERAAIIDERRRGVQRRFTR